jgi:acyl dehydratase
MLSEVLPPAEGGGMVVNYGVNRVRFPAPVPSGRRVRGRFRVTSVEEAAGGERATIEAHVECEDVEKPVCVAELVVLTQS